MDLWIGLWRLESTRQNVNVYAGFREQFAASSTEAGSSRSAGSRSVLCRARQHLRNLRDGPFGWWLG
jgi:hypothetical protein